MTLAKRAPGWLLENGGATAVERFFTLRDGRLEHSTSEAGPCIGAIELLGAKLSPLPATLHGPAALQLRTNDGSAVQLELPDEQERDAWVFELNLGSLRAASGALGGMHAHTPGTTGALGSLHTPVQPPNQDAGFTATRTPPASYAVSVTPKRAPPTSYTDYYTPVESPKLVPPASPAAAPPSRKMAVEAAVTPASSPSRGKADLGVLARFIKSAACFTISRMWSDLIATFFFGLHPEPFCGGFLDVECRPEASSTRQFYYALGLVPLAGLAKHISEGERWKGVPGVAEVPTIVGYAVGWASGNAFMQLLVEFGQAHPEFCSASAGCVGIELVLTFLLSIVFGFTIVVLQPLTQNVECGDGAVIDWLEDWLEDIWALVTRGVESTTMVLWYFTLSNLANVGLEGAPPLTRLNMLFFFACSFFYLGSYGSVVLERIEGGLRRRQRSSEPQAWREAALRYSDTLQGLLGYVAGCGASDFFSAIFWSLSLGPTLGVSLLNLGIATSLTLLVCCWLSRTGELQMSEDRESVEKYFVTNSMSFFIGWAWLVVARDLVTMVGIVFEFGLGWLSLFVEPSTTAFLAQSIAALVSCPTLTVAMLRAEHAFLRRAGVEPPPEKLKGKLAPTRRAAAEQEML